jgi:hypothetical protein
VVGNSIVLPSNADYTDLREQNWFAIPNHQRIIESSLLIRGQYRVQTAWASPDCIFEPRTVEELHHAVPILVGSKSSFAIRSGGHSPNHGFANIDGGVLVDMSNFTRLEYDAATNTAVVGAGLRWGEVYAGLQAYNVTVVGGRVLDVGVGGLTLGCMLLLIFLLILQTADTKIRWTVMVYGPLWPAMRQRCELSSKSQVFDIWYLLQHKLTCEKVVLASGSVVNANAESNAGLFWALKGGGNNFGKFSDGDKVEAED